MYRSNRSECGGRSRRALAVLRGLGGYDSVLYALCFLLISCLGTVDCNTRSASVITCVELRDAEKYLEYFLIGKSMFPVSILPVNYFKNIGQRNLTITVTHGAGERWPW